MRIRPCIDIHDGKVKQIVGASLCDEKGGRGPVENFACGEDAAYYADIYREKQLPGGHIILLNARSDSKAYEADKQQALRALKTYPGGMQIGGGITDENAQYFLEAGASHVIVTSFVFRGGDLQEQNLQRIVKSVGKEHLVLDLSCKKRADGSYAVVTDRWQKETRFVICDQTLTYLMHYCDEFLIHAADAEGKRGGIEEDLVRLLGQWQIKSTFPLTYAGGVHALEDLSRIKRLSGNYMDVTVGSALDLFGGDLSLDELIKEAEATTTP